MSYAALLLTLVIGVFFAITGWHKTFHPGRVPSFRRTIAKDLGIPLGSKWLVPVAYWVSGWELAAGVGLLLAPLWVWWGLPIVAYLFLFPAFVILLVALACEGYDKTCRWEPHNLIDHCNCWIYLPDMLMVVMILAIWLDGVAT